MKPSIHKLQKQIAREQQHLEWLERNLRGSKQHHKSVALINELQVTLEQCSGSSKKEKHIIFA
jgi:hypothetical protein